MIELPYFGGSSSQCRGVLSVSLLLTLCMIVSSSTLGFGTRSSMIMNDGGIHHHHRTNNNNNNKNNNNNRNNDIGLSKSSTFVTESCWKLRGGSSSEEEEEEEVEDSEDEDDSDMEDSDDDDENSDDDGGGGGGVKVTSPLKLLIRTNLMDSMNNDQSNAIDISPAIELMCTRSRSILSIKQSLSRSLRGRPPLELLQLIDSRTGQTVSDDALVQELANDDDDDDDDEEEDMEEITLYLDMIPPVDPKFGTLLPEQLTKTSTQELLDLYAANVASMHANSHALFLLSQPTHDDDEDETTTTRVSVIWNLKQHASAYKQHILSNLLTKEQQQQLLLQQQQQQQSGENDEDEYTSSTNNNDSFLGGDVLLKESVKRKGGIKGGATMQVKRALQKNLNINWADTIRNFFLFLFFGYFGGRDVFSRTVMLLGAPMCFVLQLRPVKIMIKQLFYAIGEPPGIFLSLLAAPQQAIMSLDYNAAMKDLYGDDAANDLMESPEKNDTNNDSLDDDDDDDDYMAVSSEGEDSDDVYDLDDDYDDEYDDE